MAKKQGDGTRDNWQRVPGASRRYINKQTGETISRHEYDRRFGSLREFSTYRAKAAQSKRVNPEAVLRPAKGRKKATHLKGEARRAEVEARQRAAREAEAERKIQKQWHRHFTVPSKIDLRNFRRGKLGRNIELPIKYAPVEQVRQAAQKSGVVFAYMVGANLITDQGEERTISFFTSRHISMRFTPEDYSDGIEKALRITYAKLVSLFIHLSLKIEIARKRNDWKGRTRLS